MLLKLKKRDMKRQMHGALARVPGGSYVDVTLMLMRNPRYRGWASTAGASIFDIERLINHG